MLPKLATHIQGPSFTQLEKMHFFNSLLEPTTDSQKLVIDTN